MKLRHALIPLLVFVVALAGETAAAAAARNIKVGVASDVTSGTLLGRSLTLKDAQGASVTLSAGGKVSAAGGYVTAGGKRLKAPVRVTGSGLGWNSTRYRGSLLLISAPRGMTVVNELDIESYLLGVLKMEVNPEWHPEALKAQAIISRTYALRNMGRFASKGYDLDATENSQVYRGINAEDPRATAAVNATAGCVIRFGGELASVYFHSDSGGATADISHVWGSSVPYLVCKNELVNVTSPNSNWRLTLSPNQVAAALSKMKLNVGNVQGLRVTQSDGSGRAVLLAVVGDRGEAEVRAHAFRMAIGSRVLRSTFFEVSNVNAIASKPQPATVAAVPPAVEEQTAAPLAAKPAYAAEDLQEDPIVELTRNGVFTKEEMLDMLMHPDKRPDYLRRGLARIGGKPAVKPQTPPPAPVPVPIPAPVIKQQNVASATGLTLIGKGWGHGVGLSQWGAKAMADQGMSCEAILAHYFPGTTIGQ